MFFMTASAIRKQLHTYLDVANDKKVKAIYALVEEDIADKTETGDHWNDPAFVTEMNRRAADMESGKDKGRSWEEVHTSVRQKAKVKAK